MSEAYQTFPHCDRKWPETMSSGFVWETMVLTTRIYPERRVIDSMMPQLSNEELLRLAALHPPPPEWYDEDFSALWEAAPE